MGWKSTLRSLQAFEHRAEREAQQRKHEFEKQRHQLGKMQELERAAFEFHEYENDIALLMSVHKESSNVLDWNAIYSSDPPAKPIQFSTREESARIKLEGFKPGVFDKLLNRAETKRDKLLEAIDEARQVDEREYQEALQAYEQDYADWEATRELAGRILEGNLDAYLDVIKQVNPFSNISELGSSVEFQAESNCLIEVTLHVNSEQVIPSETKILLKGGKLSVKPMPKGQFYDLYQDYICSCVLRVARELFALLPIKMVIVNAMSNLLNTQTGSVEEKPILSVAIPRDIFEGLNIDTLDPSDSMNNFVHRMMFKKAKGFSAIEALTSLDLQGGDFSPTTKPVEKRTRMDKGISTSRPKTGSNWRQSAAHLLLLSKFGKPRLVDDFSKSTVWEVALGEASSKVIEHFLADGLLEQASLEELLDYKYRVPELKPMLVQRGLPVSGHKAELIKRLVQADFEGMKEIVHSLSVLRHTEQGQMITEQYLAQEKKERANAEEQTLQALRQRMFKEACMSVAAFEARQVFPRGIDVDWKHYNAAHDVAMLETMFAGSPKIFSTLSEQQRDCLRIAAGMTYLWGTDEANKWLPSNFETGLVMDNDAAVRMFSFYASYQLDIAEYRALGVKTVEILTTDNSCGNCKRLAGKKYKLSEVPELPYEKCTSEMGCRCTIVVADF